MKAFVVYDTVLFILIVALLVTIWIIAPRPEASAAAPKVPPVETKDVPYCLAKRLNLFYPCAAVKWEGFA